jgi:Asp-tRNA(Asn)/Glu-tRNA(Gln) amidotransferase A subunit family amidase
MEKWKDETVDPPILYGVPVSIKDCVALKGSLHTFGLACRTAEHLRATQDCVVVQVLRSAGALPMVKGNIPQILMLPETFNNVWGRTRNPWNLERVPGKLLLAFPSFVFGNMSLMNLSILVRWIFGW